MRSSNPRKLVLWASIGLLALAIAVGLFLIQGVCFREAQLTDDVRDPQKKAGPFVDEEMVMSIAATIAKASHIEEPQIHLADEITDETWPCREYTIGEYELFVIARGTRQESAFHISRRRHSWNDSEEPAESCNSLEAFEALMEILKPLEYLGGVSEWRVDAISVRHDGEKRILAWRFFRQPEPLGEECRGGGIMASVNAYTRELDRLEYMPAIASTAPPEIEIPTEVATANLAKWLESIDTPSGVRFELPTEGESMPRVLAYPIRIASAFYYAGNRTGEGNLPEICSVGQTAYYCWEIPVTFEDRRRHLPGSPNEFVYCDEVYWVDRITGEIIGGAKAPTE